MRNIVIRPIREDDHSTVGEILGTLTRKGESWPVSPAYTNAEALAFWFSHGQVFVAELDGEVVGTHFVGPNATGGGSHVANGGFGVAQLAWGSGVGRSMCTHAVAEARRQGYRAMQFNTVLSCNDRALALYESLGFTIVGCVPEAFLHPTKGYVDFLIMHRFLQW